MEKDDSVYLRHIFDALSRIQEYTKGMVFDKFSSASVYHDAVIRQIQIVGEASKRLSPEFKSGHPQVPWKDISGMRDKLVHDYMGVDLKAVWKTVQEDVPELKKEISRILEKQGKKSL